MLTAAQSLPAKAQSKKPLSNKARYTQRRQNARAQGRAEIFGDAAAPPLKSIARKRREAAQALKASISLDDASVAMAIDDTSAHLEGATPIETDLSL